MSAPKRDLRPMMRAARDGDHSAAKALLKLYGFDQIAAEIKPGKPYSNRVRKAVDAITAGIDTEWEDLITVEPPLRRSKAPRVDLFDD